VGSNCSGRHFLTLLGEFAANLLSASFDFGADVQDMLCEVNGLIVLTERV